MKPAQFATNLRSVRLSRDLSQSDLADISGIPQSQLSDFETGRRTPSLNNLIRLHKAIACPWDELLTEPKKKQK